MCSDPLDPGGQVRGCSVGWAIGTWNIEPFRAAAALNVHTVFPKLKKKHFHAGVFWVRRDFVFFTVGA